MTAPFTDRLVRFITSTPVQSPESLRFVRNAFEDTLAVAFAGWGEPVTRRVASLYPALEAMTPDGDAPVDAEPAALIYGAAAHALDFDDVHQTSSTHPSAPIVAALAAAVRSEPELSERAATAFAVGLGTNVALGQVMGFTHYLKGWHATSTIGPMATASALAFLYGLDDEAAAHALALAAAQCGGLQRNFGAMAKPVQAGLAASAGLRAARMARVGITADRDVFGPKGYFDLYQGASLENDPDTVTFDLQASGISVKLYPCCYGNHRLIAATLQAREALAAKGVPLDRLAEIDLIGPAGAYTPLRVQDPQSGLEGKFCGAYNVATALLDGTVSLSHFEDDKVQRPDVRALMQRIRLVEREGSPEGLKRQSTKQELVARAADGTELVRTEQVPYPGSPDSPPTDAQIETKVRDCLAHYERTTGHACSYERFQAVVDGLLQSRPAMARAGAAD